MLLEKKMKTTFDVISKLTMCEILYKQIIRRKSLDGQESELEVTKMLYCGFVVNYYVEQQLQIPQSG